MKNQVCKLLNIQYPIFQGGMTLVTDVNLVSAVSNAGALGIYAAGIDNIDIEYLREQIRKLREATDKPFGFNIMLASRYAAQIVDLVCEEKVPVVTTGAGNPIQYMEKFKKANVLVAPVVSSKEAAIKMEAAGADLVIAEGMESGGYIGNVTTISLIPQVVDSVKIPVLAAGGIADGRGMAAAFMLGAQGIQMGTRFLTTKECAIPESCKDAIVEASSRDAIVLGDRIGVPMRIRVLKTRTIAEISAYEGEKNASIEKYNEAIVEARGKLYSGDPDQVLLGAGQSVGLVNDKKSVQDVITDIIRQFNEILKPLL